MAHATARDVMRESLTPCLEPGEQLRAVGGFQSGGRWTDLPKPTFFTIRNWFVGVTDKRVILAKAGRLNGKILQDAVFTVPRDKVVVKGGQLRITSPDGNVPKRLRSLLGSGYNRDEFAKALSS